MQRKLKVLGLAVAGFLIASSLLVGTGWSYNSGRSHVPEWLHRLKGSPVIEAAEGNSSSPPTNLQTSPELPILKHGNKTLLQMAPSSVNAIMNPEDTSFPRLSCPAPTSDRYLHLQAKSTDSNRPDPQPVKYFFALDLYQCAGLLPRLIGSVVESIRFLGPENCALSIIEGRSDDGTFEILLSLREEMQRLGVKYYFNTSDINPTVGDRIEGLAELRNLALQPLLDDFDNAFTDATMVVFINDVAICMEDILELIYQHKFQNADMTCAMDWVYVGPDPTFYDVWIARGMNGDTFFNIPEDGNWNSAWNLFWNNPNAQAHQRAGKPFQVFSCWNGATTFTARPFLESKIRFRASHWPECPQGEPKTWCAEMWYLGYGKIAAIPSVNLGYSDEDGEKIKALKGYVSRFVGETDEADEKIEWEAKPPDTVKCMPTYDNQTWLHWEIELA